MSDVTPLLSSERAKADQERAEWLLSIASDVLEISELFDTVLMNPDSALSKITLRELLLTQPRWGKGRTKHVLDGIRSTLGVDTPTREMTVGWLLDRRVAGASRMLAWVDAFDPRDKAPWTGYPFAPKPEGV